MLAKRLRAEREKRGMTQKELGDLLGVTDAAIGMWENGKRTPDPAMLQRIADVFQVSTDYLLGRTDDPHGTFTPDPDNANAEAIAKITAALQSDPELLEFWEELSRRNDLRLMFKQVRDLSPQSIRRVIRVIKAIEDEEAE